MSVRCNWRPRCQRNIDRAARPRIKLATFNDQHAKRLFQIIFGGPECSVRERRWIHKCPMPADRPIIICCTNELVSDREPPSIAIPTQFQCYWKFHDVAAAERGFGIIKFVHRVLRYTVCSVQKTVANIASIRRLFLQPVPLFSNCSHLQCCPSRNCLDRAVS